MHYVNIMHILVTGGLGYIGSHTVIELIKRNYEVIIVDNLCNSSEDILDKIERISGVKPQFYNIDLTNKDALIYSDISNIDCIIHFAALKSVAESNEHPLNYYKNNIISLLNLLDFAKNIDCKNIIFSSSATVYPHNATSPLKEDAPAGAANNRYNTILTGGNPYGTTKIICEQILHDLAAADQAWKICCLRYFNPVGCHSSGILGEDFKTEKKHNNLFPSIMSALYYNRGLTIFGNDYNISDGTAVRDYIHVVDLADAHCMAMQHLVDGCTVYNVGTGRGTSVLEIIHEFNKQGLSIDYTIGARRKGDAECIYADPSKIQSDLEWCAKYSLVDMVKDTINYYNRTK